MKPFTTAAAVVLLIVAAAHVYRLAVHAGVTVGSYTVPMWISVVGALGAGLLSAMLFLEARR